jgi:hypothetical protein
MDWIFKLIGGIVENPIAGSVKWIAGALKDVLITIFKNTIIPLLNNVMAYQNFFSEGVNNGWDIVRNFSNLFFALALLLIAISTVLNIGALDNYTAKRMLPNFIFVALFINFSKAIVGLLIDISQIIMISFYNSFGPSMTDVIGNAAKIAEAAAESNTEDLTINIFTIVIVALLAFVLLWTALILAMRIVTLWFVIMLSPLAFMSSLIPGLRNINSEWTKSLQEALITGPTLMFLLYLGFAVMSQGISANTTTTGDNLVNNGNLINYVLVVGLIWFANTTASKAAQSAPPMLKNAVGVAGTVATFGLGAYVGAGGYNTNQLRKKTLELGDKGIGGATRTIQAGSLGNVKLNSRYESFKKDMVARNDAGIGVFRGLGQQFSKAGQEEQQKDFETQYATDLAVQGKLDDPANERYKKIFNADLAKETKELDESGLSLVELRKQLYKSIQEDNLKMQQATLLQITKLGEIGKLFEDDPNSDINENTFFTNIAKNNATEGEMADALVEKIKPKNAGNAYVKSSIARDFRTRLKRVGADKKGQAGFVANIETSGAATVGAGSVINKGLVTAIDEINKNPNLFRERDGVAGAWTIDPNTRKPKFNANRNDILALIAKESSLSTLMEPKTWQKLNPTSKAEFFQVVDAEIRANPTGPNIQKYQAAKQGLTN